MRHAAIEACGGPDELTVETADEAQRPGPEQVLVDVEAAGVNDSA